MKKLLNKYISALTLSMFIISAPMAQGMSKDAPVKNPVRTETMPSTSVRQKPFLLAENKENTAGDKAQTATGIKDQVSDPESGPGTDKKDPSAESKTVPLKPFKPSEEIAAEQAVDFPVDI